MPTVGSIVGSAGRVPGSKRCLVQGLVSGPYNVKSVCPTGHPAYRRLSLRSVYVISLCLHSPEAMLFSGQVTAAHAQMERAKEEAFLILLR